MISLSFNTTGSGTQFCLQKDDKFLTLETEFSKHSESFFPMLDDFLKQNKTSLDDVDVFGVVVGPGSFTGIRIGLSVIKMFGFAKQKKCVAVNALEVLAYNNFKQITNQKIICSVINAGADNLYYQLFENTLKNLKPLTSPKVCSFAQFEKIKEKLKNVLFCYYDDKKQSSQHAWLNDYFQELSAGSLGECIDHHIKENDFCDFHKIVPLYLRSSQAEKIVFNQFEIIKATENNLQQILQLENLAEDGMAWSKTALQQSFENQSFKCFMLMFNNQTLGYVSIMDLSDEYEILRIVVDHNSRNQGVAKNLLKFLFKKARQEDVKSIVLEVNEFNFSAQLLYEQMGFDVVGKRTNYYHDGQDGFVMRKYVDLE